MGDDPFLVDTGNVKLCWGVMIAHVCLSAESRSIVDRAAGLFTNVGGVAQQTTPDYMTPGFDDCIPPFYLKSTLKSHQLSPKVILMGN